MVRTTNEGNPGEDEKYVYQVLQEDFATNRAG